MSADIATQLSRLVAAEWSQDTVGGWATWVGRLGWDRAIYVQKRSWASNPWVANLYWGSERLAPETLDGAGQPDPVSALSALCCQPLAVAILHGLGAFPEVDEPDCVWPWWYSFVCGLVRITSHPLDREDWTPEFPGELFYSLPDATEHFNRDEAMPDNREAYAPFVRAPAPPRWRE